MDFTPEQQEAINQIVQGRITDIKNKYADYDSIKTKVNELETYKAQAEYNIQLKVKEALDAKEAELKTKYESELNNLKAEQVRDAFLSSAEIKLPSAYKQMIKASTNKEEVETSYKEVVKTWKEEMKALGLDKANIDLGAPGNPGGTKVTKKFSEMSYQEKEDLYKQDPELYKKLKASN